MIQWYYALDKAIKKAKGEERILLIGKRQLFFSILEQIWRFLNQSSIGRETHSEGNCQVRDLRIGFGASASSADLEEAYKGLVAKIFTLPMESLGINTLPQAIDWQALIAPYLDDIEVLLSHPESIEELLAQIKAAQATIDAARDRILRQQADVEVALVEAAARSRS